MPTMRVLGPSIAFLRRHSVLTFVLTGAFFLLSGITSVNLYVMLTANIGLFRMYGSQAIDDGAVWQLAEILGMGFLSVALFVLFVVCERVFVDRLTANLRDVASDSN